MCNFKIEFKGSVEDGLKRAKEAIEKAGGTFNGDASRGEFSVPTPKIKGDYAVAGQTVTINITDKPFFIPCSAIEKFLRGKLEKNETLTVLPTRSAFSSDGSTLVAFAADPDNAGITSLAAGDVPFAPFDENALESRVSSADGCVGFLGVLQICYGISGDGVKVTLKLVGTTIGTATLNASKPCVKLGGGAAGFKAQVTICFEISELTLSVTGEVCAPIIGCKKGTTSIRV